MSLLWSHRFLRHLIVLAVLAGSGVLLAQDGERIAALIQENRIDELARLHEENRITAPDWRKLVDAIFEPDGEAAVQQMMFAHADSDDPRLKSLVRERVALFYAARGYYETARRIREEADFFARLQAIKGARPAAAPAAPTPSSDPGDDIQQVEGDGRHFGVQVGAFSTYENAATAVEKYRRQFANITIMQRERRRNTLYLVVASGYGSRSEAEIAAQKIRDALGIKGYIIQY